MVAICNECGRSVAMVSGRFVNRVPDFDEIETRKEMGKPYPLGDFMCEECWIRIYDKCTFDGPCDDKEDGICVEYTSCDFRGED